VGPAEDGAPTANAKPVSAGAPTCAVVVDTRGASVPMSRGMSPVIVDSSGRTVWPDPGAVNGVSSELANDTGIALFFRDPAEIPKGEFAKIQTINAIGTQPPPNAPKSRFNDWAVVSPADAGKIASTGLSCRMIFLVSR